LEIEAVLTSSQVKETIPYLRDSKGSVVFVSSGAALKGYTAWGAYGGSKAALNSLAQHLAVEEPKIASIAIGPGRVDTDMQKELRAKGAAAMSETDYAGFQTAFEEGKLNKPEWPGHVIARLALGTKPELSGKYLRYVPKGWPQAAILIELVGTQRSCRNTRTGNNLHLLNSQH
jgi:NAD(P)-dependent dehydrogenase (short-subunit alcohol dehydrogenase family)